MRQFKPGQLQSGSLYPITASNAVTASYASNALTASYTLGLDTGSLVTTSSFNAFTASYTTGSFTGSFKGDGIITGSLFGTASWANNAVTASYIVTAQTASYVLNAISASYAASASQALSSSFAFTASFVTASNVFGPYGANSTISSSRSISSSFALTASYVTPLQQNVIITGSIYIPDNAHSIYFSGSNAASRLVWNDTDGTLDLGLKGGNVTLQLGQEQVVRVVNKTGANLLESQYKVVRIRRVDEGGAQGQRLAIVLAQANNDSNSVDTLGIVTENIDVNQEGFITNSGLVRGINTTGTLQGETWSDGDLLYLSPTTPGALTTIKPQAPDHTVVMGYVVYSHINQGKIFVKVDNGYEIDELHNVRITTASLAAGQLLVRSGSNASGVWINTNQLTGSYGLTGLLTATQITASNLYAGPTYISGSLIVNGQSIFYGTASFVNVTASNLFVSQSFISVNVFEPVERFGGLKVYDSGSSAATASLAWDSLHNHWVYQNASGSSYSGGMFLSGPRNTGSLGDEPNLTKWFVPRGDGGDHLNDSQIFTSGSTTLVTGSLTVTAGVTASFTGSFAGNGAGLGNIPASGIVGLNLSQIASSSFTASVTPTQFTITSASITEFSVTGTGVTIGNVVTDTHNVTGSLNVTGSIVGNLNGTASFATAAISSSFPLRVSGSSLYSVYHTGISTNFSTTQSIFLGSNSGTGASSANNSIFIGQSGISATSASNSNFFGNTAGNNAARASNSNFFGNGAGNLATSASNSNFFGITAGQSATRANNSNFIGRQAGIQSTDANNSNFLGQNAGNQASNANNSNFLGNAAGQFAISASNSNFFGTSAGYNGANASDSNFFGREAGYGADRANNSNFLGAQTGYNAISASRSNFFGIGAGAGATFANESNFIGTTAGYQATSASYSTLIGYNVGSNIYNNATIGSNNIVIGTNISLPANTSNAINLGAIIYATGSYATVINNPLTSSVSNGKVGINTFDPQYNLHVSGNIFASNGITGSLFGTASWAENSITASFASIATSASYAQTSSIATSASYAQTATSASFAVTASHVLNVDVPFMRNRTYPNATSTIRQYESIFNPSNLTILNTSIFIIEADADYYILGDLINSGSLIVDGTLRVDGTIYNAGSITGTGIIE